MLNFYKIEQIICCQKMPQLMDSVPAVTYAKTNSKNPIHGQSWHVFRDLGLYWTKKNCTDLYFTIMTITWAKWLTELV